MVEHQRPGTPRARPRAGELRKVGVQGAHKDVSDAAKIDGDRWRADGDAVGHQVVVAIVEVVHGGGVTRARARELKVEADYIGPVYIPRGLPVPAQTGVGLRWRAGAEQSAQEQEREPANFEASLVLFHTLLSRSPDLWLVGQRHMPFVTHSRCHSGVKTTDIPNLLVRRI